MKRTVSNAG